MLPEDNFIAYLKAENLIKLNKLVLALEKNGKALSIDPDNIFYKIQKKENLVI